MTILVADWSSFDLVLPIARQFGVGLEIQEFINPENLDGALELAKAIRNKAKNLSLLSMHGPFAELVPASWDPLVRQVAQSRFQQAYDIAQRIRAQHLILHSGFIPKTYQIDRWVQNSYDFWIKFLEDKANPGLIHVENVYEDDFSSLRGLIDKVNATLGVEVLTANLDIGHVNANSSRGLEEWIAGLGDRIRYVHLHNNGGRLDDHWRLDQGTINLPRVLDLLQMYAVNATWCVETTVDDIEPSLLWMRDKGYLK